MNWSCFTTEVWPEKPSFSLTMFPSQYLNGDERTKTIQAPSKPYVTERHPRLLMALVFLSSSAKCFRSMHQNLCQPGEMEGSPARTPCTQWWSLERNCWMTPAAGNKAPAMQKRLCSIFQLHISLFTWYNIWRVSVTKTMQWLYSSKKLRVYL